jgi:hypothetical protein
MHHGEVLRPVMQNAVGTLKQHIPRHPGQILAENMISKMQSQWRHKLEDLRKEQEVTDTILMDKALKEFQALRAQRQAIHPLVEPVMEPMQVDEKAVEPLEVGGKLSTKQRGGFVVLGMHRSGTSMLSGLLVQGSGYNVGGPLIGGAFDNEKGFFELVDAVLQNDEFMNLQHVWWSDNVMKYNHEVALQDKKTGKAKFEHGKRALNFLNNPQSVPWLQKDPRMCITFKTWLPLLNTEPAVVFTHRHPLEVAYSLKKRERNFSLEHGLRLWIIYNMRAIQNTVGMCRVVSSNEAVLADPLSEVQRIADELTSKCNVPAAPRKVTKEDVDKFVDQNLQHHKKQGEEEDKKKAVLEDRDGCKILEYQGDFKPGTPDAKRESALYMIAMRMFCDFNSGKAYADDYAWPSLP